MTDRIITDLDRLRTPSAPVEFDAKTRFASKKLLTAASQRRCLGLAAPQVGLFRRMFLYDLSPYSQRERGGLRPRGVVCNPKLLSASADTWDREEGCLSFPRRFIIATRPVSAHFEWFDVDGNRHEVTLSGMPGRVWLHESDHLDGVLMVDRAAPEAKLTRL